MKYASPIILVVLCLVVLAFGPQAMAWERAACFAYQGTPWHGPYYNVQWGMPVALVVPPTAENQTHYNWGVGGTCITPICHQFRRAWPGPSHYDARLFRPAPPWPSSTDQHGTYYVRGPW